MNRDEPPLPVCGEVFDRSRRDGIGFTPVRSSSARASDWPREDGTQLASCNSPSMPAGAVGADGLRTLSAARLERDRPPHPPMGYRASIARHPRREEEARRADRPRLDDRDGERAARAAVRRDRMKANPSARIRHERPIPPSPQFAGFSHERRRVRGTLTDAGD